MNRRHFLAAGAAAGIGGLAGCLGTLPGGANSDGQDRYDRSEWQSDIIGSVRLVTDGIVLGRERGPDPDGEIFSLDIETGEREWSFGQSGPFGGYSEPAVGDALFFGRNNDAIGDGHGEMYALEFDGSRRWTRDTGSVYSRPTIPGDLVYVASDDGIVRAFDAESGNEAWATPIEHGHPNPEVLAVSEVVYVENDALFALDPTDGEVLWTYAPADEWAREASVMDEVVFSLGKEAIRAVADGELRWRVPFEEVGGRQTTRLAYLPAIDADHVYVSLDDRIHALATDSGEEMWMVDEMATPRLAVADDRVYVYALDREDGGLHAVDAGSGETVWTDDRGSDDRFLRVIVVDGHRGDEHAVFVGDSAAISRYAPDGERTWEWAPDVELGRFAVDEFVYAGTEDGVRALDPA